MEIICRERYLKKLESWIGKENVIVLTGQRRVGKSFVLKDFVRQHEGEANIIYVDKEKRQFRFHLCPQLQKELTLKIKTIPMKLQLLRFFC